jgi:hypothetical protein
MQNLGSSVDSISASNTRMLELEKILSTISINESSVRSFIISGDSSYLQKRFYPKSSLKPQFDKLRNLSKSVRNDKFTCDSLQKLIDKRYVLFDTALNVAGTAVKNHELNLVLAKSDSLTDQIRDYISKSMGHEVANLDIYRINHKYEIETSIITSFLLVTLALFIILISLNRINYDLKNLKNVNDELRFLNFTFNNAEKIAGISHWKYNLTTKKYTFSDNFYNLIGLNPEDAEPNLDNILVHLHPNDRNDVYEAYTASLQNKTPTSLIYRLYRNNGEMRYIKSIGSFAENSHGELVKIGVNYDITDQYKNTKSLEESNEHLKAVNAELEAFNNIVSHDLQEPLRKIQLFISRIAETEAVVLSEAGKDYFKKIASSANRMQNLLIDLVNYSRTMKGDKEFEQCSLREIVEDVLNELAVNIQDRNAKIHFKELPVINGIPFQLHQLFVNLFTNALKFSREGIPPEITIEAQEILESEVYASRAFHTSKYHKIIVSDNGIGFKQEFADKIFQMFRRLEQDTFQGTGIGLAICKKIIENHNGFIFAEGIPDKGAKFIIYLPK